LQGLQETAASVFAKKPEPPSEQASYKKLASTPPLAAPTVSPLARFLLTRLVRNSCVFSLLSIAMTRNEFLPLLQVAKPSFTRSQFRLIHAIQNEEIFHL